MYRCDGIFVQDTNTTKPKNRCEQIGPVLRNTRNSIPYRKRPRDLWTVRKDTNVSQIDKKKILIFLAVKELSVYGNMTVIGHYLEWQVSVQMLYEWRNNVFQSSGDMEISLSNYSVRIL